ncbi:NAD(P)-binding protein [Gonapodya prolifera JEL478]|uniref:NAD(P)-binding protein n=1 Tax=Gonapodya prolifera (strain JEL478) TaxID=1344416 RepID=A0A139A6U8_GONPJ|nr:NAD(P)-binding protein [Gonapodya prolifera JEL478]|eukprot:KXS12542.1 NAD(P)-binding protein [Gonapodya prolifera JEL478]
MPIGQLLASKIEGARLAFTDLLAQSELTQTVLKQISVQGLKSATFLQHNVTNGSQWEHVVKNSQGNEVRHLLNEKEGFSSHLTMRHRQSAIMGVPHIPSYSASKGGIRFLSKSVALHCANSSFPGGKIRVNSVYPGMVEPPMLKPDYVELLRTNPDAAKAIAPLGRGGTAEDVANAIAFLASQESSYITVGP